MAKRKGRNIPNVLGEAEQVAMLEVPNRKCPTGRRNYTMIRLMLNAGLRCSEVLHLRIGDVDWTSGRLHVVQGKGAKDRVLWLNEEMLADLMAWREMRPGGHGEAEDLIFTTLQGKPVYPQYLWAMVGRVARKAGIGRKVNPHLLRHTFATGLLRSCGNLAIVQKALGHALPNTTAIYTHLIDDDVKDAMQQFQGVPV